VSTATLGGDLLERLFGADAFPPTEGTAALEALRDEVLVERQAAFVALLLRISAARDEVGAAAAAALERFLQLSRDVRLAIAGDPAYCIWLQSAARAEQQDSSALRETVVDLSEVLSRCIDRLEMNDAGLGLNVQLARYDVDPLVAAAAPPTYVFPDSARARELEEKTPYTLDVFREVARAALARIAATWPAVALMFPAYVRTVVHLPYADFRSASASRYTGLIFLTADDRTILEVEESIVHEWGHQVLYAVMELDQVVVDGDRGDLALPWSGARRDFYGYFHALFVYVLLLRYLEQIEARDDEELERARELFAHILRGAARALPDFEDDSRFTPRGRELRDLLRHAVEIRVAAHPEDLLGGDADDEHSGSADD
jgi:hypothetical protein